MTPIKIITFTPAWRRPEILEIHLDGIHRLQHYKPRQFKIIPFYIVSEHTTAQQIKKRGYKYIFAPNTPLGQKKNIGLNHILQNIEFDYIMEMGSDDLATNEYLDLIHPYLQNQTPTFHIHNVYFIDTITGQVAYWETPKILGAARCISRKAIQKVVQTNTPLWEPQRNRGMDTCSWRNLNEAGQTNTIIEVGEEVYTIDIKSETNINTMQPFTKSPKTKDEILRHFPNERHKIERLIAQNSNKKQSNKTLNNILNKHLYGGQ